jgi:hypothetical protein
VADVTRLEQELADALGLAQAVRTAAAEARALVPYPKVRARLEAIEDDVAALQERVNAIVVADAAKRTPLIDRSRRVREAQAGATAERPGGDALDALQALAAEAAYALAQWKVVRPLARAAGDERVAKLARRGIRCAERHLELTLDACRRVAKREAKRAAAPA